MRWSEQRWSDNGGKCVDGNSDCMAVASALVGTVSVTFGFIEIVFMVLASVLEQTEAKLQYDKLTDNNSGQWQVR